MSDTKMLKISSIDKNLKTITVKTVTIQKPQKGTRFSYVLEVDDPDYEGFMDMICDAISMIGSFYQGMKVISFEEIKS